MARPTPLPPEELTRAMVDAAFAEVERVAAERGVDSASFTGELLHRAVDRMWVDEDREALRAKLCGAVSSYVDGLFDSIGDEQVAA